MPSKTLTAKLLLYLFENPGTSLKELSIVFNASLKTIRTVVYRLKNNGFIEKTGTGYILTSKGEWFVNNVLKKDEGVVKEAVNFNRQVAEKPNSHTEAVVEKNIDTVERDNIAVSSIKIDDVINKIIFLEGEIDSIKNVLNRLVRELNSLKKSIEEMSKLMPKSEERPALPKPVMNIHEAMSILGSQLDKYRLEGKVEVIGSLVVDRSFYESFKKKFPIDISEVDKLSDLERILLDEMIRDARVIKQSGKQYRLVS